MSYNDLTFYKKKKRKICGSHKKKIPSECSNTEGKTPSLKKAKAYHEMNIGRHI